MPAVAGRAMVTGGRDCAGSVWVAGLVRRGRQRRDNRAKRLRVRVLPGHPVCYTNTANNAASNCSVSSVQQVQSIGSTGLRSSSSVPSAFRRARIGSGSRPQAASNSSGGIFPGPYDKRQLAVGYAVAGISVWLVAGGGIDGVSEKVGSEHPAG